eukprot:8590323-Alexandrium_andersonii.AAC.1
MSCQDKQRPCDWAYALGKHYERLRLIHLPAWTTKKRPLGMAIGHVNANHEIRQPMSRIGHDTRNVITAQGLEG